MRNGKIATLPSDIRDILSWRMEQGEKWKKMALAPWQAMLERNSMEGMLKMTYSPDAAAQIAERMTAIKFDLPTPKKAPAQQPSQTVADCPQDAPPGQAESKPVKPSQSEKKAPTVKAAKAPSGQAGSNPVKASQSETSGLTVNPEPAEARLKTAA